MKNNTRTVLFLMVAVLALCSAGCVDSIARQKAENEIAKILPEVLGPADTWDVKVEGNARQLMDGKIKSVKIAGANVRVNDLPPLAKLEATLSDVQADTRSMMITKAGSGTWTGYLAQEQVVTLLKGKMRYFSDYSVDLKKDTVLVTGTVTLKGLSAKGSLTGKPGIRNGNEVWITPLRVDVMGMGVDVPGWSVKRLEHIVNPVYTVPVGDLELKVKKITSEVGYIRMEGSFDVMAISQAKKKSSVKNQSPSL